MAISDDYVLPDELSQVYATPVDHVSVTGVHSTISSDDFYINMPATDWTSISSVYINPTATPFVDYVPHPEQIEEMSKEYPALAKAFENFKTVYAIVEQDWKGKNE